MKNFKKLNQKNTVEEKLKKTVRLVLCVGLMIVPILAFGSVESSLAAVQAKLVGTLLPLAAMLGLVIAGLSFVMGHPNARTHLVYSVIGAIVGFGAESIVSLIRGVIH
jgi:hypothetical protein